MKIKALIVMTMTAAALLLPSCGKQPDKTSDANVNEPVEFGANITVSDSYAFRENDGRLYLWDLKTNSYEIFCTQPDCKHQTAAENADTKCSAVAPKEGYFYNYAFLYNDTLYSICTGELNEFLIYTADTDGMNRKLAFTAELSLCTMVNPVLDGGRLFFVGSEFEMNDTDSVGLRENYSLCSVDLSDFSFEKYMDIGTANETVIGKKSLLLYKNKIYFQHSEYSENSVHSAVECYDIDGSERMTVLEMEDSVNVWQCNGGKMLYVVSDDDDSHSQVCSYDLDGGGTEVLFKRDGYVSDVCMIGNRVFYMYSTADGKSEIRSAGVFDTSDGKDLTTEFDGDVYVSVLGHTSNGHLIHYQDSERDSFGLLSDEDFWSLKFENADFYGIESGDTYLRRRDAKREAAGTAKVLSILCETSSG